VLTNLDGIAAVIMDALKDGLSLSLGERGK
jgi:hypothetical protein